MLRYAFEHKEYIKPKIVERKPLLTALPTDGLDHSDYFSYNGKGSSKYGMVRGEGTLRSEIPLMTLLQLQ
jgi:hypothetical protein